MLEQQVNENSPPRCHGGGDERAMVRGSKWWPERVRKWGEVRWQMKTLRLLMMLEADEGEEVFVLLGRWWTLEKHLRNDPRNSDQSRIRFISNSTHQLSTHRPPFPTTIKFPTFHVFSNSHCVPLFPSFLSSSSSVSILYLIPVALKWSSSSIPVVRVIVQSPSRKKKYCPNSCGCIPSHTNSC